MARKKRRKDEETEQLLAPDAFQAQGGEVSSWLEKNIRFVGIGLLVVLAGVVLFEVFRSQGTRAASEVTSEFGEVLQTYREARDPNMVRTATSTEVVRSKQREAAEALAEFRSNHAGTGSARLGLIYEADLLRQSGDAAQAQELYESYLEGSYDGDPLRFLALENAGYAAEDQEKYEEALSFFQRLEEIDFYKAYALKHQARVLKTQGKVDEAVQTLERLLESEPSPFLKNYAEGELKVLRS